MALIIKPLSNAAFARRISETGHSLTSLAGMTDHELLQFPSIGRRTLAMLRCDTAKDVTNKDVA